MAKQAELANRSQAGLAAVEQPSMARLMELAITQGEDGAKALERLAAISERAEARQCALRFADALAAFQAECPPIKKETRVGDPGGGGLSFSYRFADLDMVATTVRPCLHKHGLSYYFDEEPVGERQLRAIFVLQGHGHETRTGFTVPAEWSSGRMSAQQKVSATNTFAKRQAMVGGLGLTTTEPDTDAAPVGTVSPDHAANIHALLGETKADEPKFLAYVASMAGAEIPAVEEIPEVYYRAAVQALERKRGQA